VTILWEIIVQPDIKIKIVIRNKGIFFIGYASIVRPKIKLHVYNKYRFFLMVKNIISSILADIIDRKL